MLLHILCMIVALASAVPGSAGFVSAPVRALDGNYGACAAIDTATVYITVANDISGAENGKIDAISFKPDQSLTDPGEGSEASSSSPAGSPSKSMSVVIVTSFVTVVPIEATPSTLTSTTTLHSTVKVTEVHTITKTLETSSTLGPIPSSDNDQVGLISTTTIIMEKPSSTVTRTLSLANPDQTFAHYPKSTSTRKDTIPVPTPVSRTLPTTSVASPNVVLADELTVDMVQISRTKISLSTMMAKSGFMNNPGSNDVTVAHIENGGLPTRTPSSTSSTVSTLSRVPSRPISPSSPTAGTPVAISSESFIADSSTSVSSSAVHALTSSTAFSTLVPPASIGSTVQYPSTRRYFNTTSHNSASNTVRSSTLAVPTSNTSQCGEQGNFTLNFDDIPPLTLGKTSLGTQPAPVFNPYHQFDFSDGFTVAPPPTGPFLPHSSPLMLEFLPSFVVGVNGSVPNTAGHGFAGQISDADHGVTGCFTFNIYSAAFGCNSTDLPCELTFTGLHYEATTNTVTSVTSQSATIPACPGLVNCHLATIALDRTFVGLSAVQIKAAAGGAPLGWWMDGLELGWFDNSCNTGLCRQSAHVR